MHEFDLIKNYFQKLSKKSISSLNLNDDVFFDKKKQIVVSVDTYIEGNHFIDFKKPDLVAKKIIRSSISDLISKGVQPKYYFISGSGNNESFSKKNLLKLTKSLKTEQKKYNIILSGGDTVFSNKLSFTITSIGFSKNIVYRNKAKLNDDIYVTGNLGDSFIGLLTLKNKIKLKKKLKEYFIKQYYEPKLALILVNKLQKFANTSIDISDGLLADLSKLINVQKLSYKIDLQKIPISQNLKKIIDEKKLSKIKLISNGDDYQILFTASRNKRRIIKMIAAKEKIKITNIGTIKKNIKKSLIVNEKNIEISLKNKGYLHQF
jgi:thiamine-monophosphate kinase